MLRAEETTCPVEMLAGEACGRLIQPATRELDPVPVCLMHSRDPHKNRTAFRAQIEAILDRYIRDFSGFVFPEANFSGTTFTENAHFRGATFSQNAHFLLATFTRNAHFHRATFIHDADFTDATFTQDADFRGATFTHGAYFVETRFAGVADCSSARFERPMEVLFLRVNHDGEAGLRLRLHNCLVEGVRFEDVKWYTEKGRLVLQDELDFREGNAIHELVADAYRRLVNNFEKVRQYELAEQCIVGEMEMRRRNPRNFILGGWEKARGYYARHGWTHRLGSYLSVAYLYRLLSLYGSSYKRAATWLLALLVIIFPALYGLVGMQLGPAADLSGVASRAPVISWWEAWEDGTRNRSLRIELLYTYWSGVTASVDIATFHRRPLVEPAGRWGRIVAALEVVAVPGQLALFLFALRRRFRR